LTILSAGAGDTEEAGGELARRLAGGDVVLLSGDLGAGKTTFVRGAARALGVEGPVTSPTFTIGNLYRAGPEAPAALLAHLDLYRLGDLRAEDPDLLADYIRPDSVAFIEWPGGAEGEIAELGRIRFRVRLDHAGGDGRTILIEEGRR
jgi:tRNA threonylcarbamoyladenosine biosynthesis protein TsaE